eukprot:CAMPEP_0201100218 /NCGR_PEP_ID=MMETSP0812-20130820/9115_1 /ASSEMBLY_ACC=CAM_ASM_000668 /TAXON_ID=98059 /ORGANISM="Dinobryon sp., Strain UTEXLB2267" /LENGTH=197 /DNA_ID=CAMNT_0047356467 /DNA_START=1265 /DNA_END=1854 /DNA_ORIENTATION=-
MEHRVQTCSQHTQDAHIQQRRLEQTSLRVPGHLHCADAVQVAASVAQGRQQRAVLHDQQHADGQHIHVAQPHSTGLPASLAGPVDLAKGIEALQTGTQHRLHRPCAGQCVDEGGVRLQQRVQQQRGHLARQRPGESGDEVPEVEVDAVHDGLAAPAAHHLQVAAAVRVVVHAVIDGVVVQQVEDPPEAVTHPAGAAT